jgi:hypothetical protein
MSDASLNVDRPPETAAGAPAADNSGGEMPPGSPRSLRELIDRVSGRGIQPPAAAEEASLLEALPFPFLALVGQREMKLALILR